MTQHRSQITFCVCAAFAVALFSTLAGAASAEDKRAAGIATDQSLFPKALGVLADEKLMFPVNMSNWPVKIDSSHQLFVDDYLLASVESIKRTVHQATKFDGNPIMTEHAPADGARPGLVWCWEDS